MDIGLVAGIEGLVSSAESASKGKRRCNGSDGLERSEDEEDTFSGVAVTSRSNKRSFSSEVPRSVDNLGLSDAMTCQQQQHQHQQLGLGLMRSDSSDSPQTQMLSFSSAGIDCGGFGLSDGGGDGSAKTLSYSSHRLPAAYSRNAGYYSSENMHGHGSSLTGWGLRGAFTPAQWIELEHQALVYKYLTANVPVPASLLIPIRKALCQSGFSAGSFPAYTYGWGPYHLGFPGSTDPEPGRCRRTDGKKWRCSRDAVPDQKYCERHINRGRHRSRKPVEGQTGQAATVSATTSALLPPKPVAVSGGSGFSFESGGSLAVAHHQQQHVKTKLTHGLVVPPATVLKLNRMQDSPELSGALSATMNQLKPKDSPFSYSDQQQHAAHYQQEEKSLQREFGSVPMDALLSSKTSSASYLMDCRNSYNNNMLGFSDQHSQVDQSPQGNPLHHLSVHDWQKDEAKREMVSWEEELKSDWTQLSMSTPIPLSSSFHPNNQDHRVGTTTQVGFSAATNGKQQPSSGAGNCNLITMGMGIGGPLGEVVVHSNNNAAVVSDGSTGGGGWDGNNNNENNGNGSSPTGVLQKAALISLSNSSSGSSPRLGDNNADENDVNNNKWKTLHHQHQQQQEVAGDTAAYC